MVRKRIVMLNFIVSCMLCVLGAVFLFFFHHEINLLKQADFSPKNAEGVLSLQMCEHPGITSLKTDKALDLSLFTCLEFELENSIDGLLRIELLVGAEDSSSDNVLFYEYYTEENESRFLVPFSEFEVPLSWYLKQNVSPSEPFEFTFDQLKELTLSISNHKGDEIKLARIGLKNSLYNLFFYASFLFFLVSVYFSFRRNSPVVVLPETETVANENELNYIQYKLIRKIILENYADQLTIENVAEKTDIPYYSVSKIIKDNTGKNFNQYINQVRIDNAKEKLQSSDIPISEIAWSAGFRNVSHFNRVFKEAENTTPSVYRKSLLKKDRDESEY